MIRYLWCRMAGMTLFCFIALLLVAYHNDIVVPPLVAVPSATPGVHVLTLWHALSEGEVLGLQESADKWADAQKEEVLMREGKTAWQSIHKGMSSCYGSRV